MDGWVGLRYEMGGWNVDSLGGIELVLGGYLSFHFSIDRHDGGARV